MGTLVLVLLGNGVVANVVLSKTKGQNSGWIVIATGWFAAVMAGVAVAQACGSPGAHINPAVSLAVAIVTGNFSNFVPPGASASYGGGQTKFGFNYGAGVKVKVATNWMVRFDFRQYETGKPDFNVFSPHGRLFQNEISAGVAFAL